ncbi:NAC domain containing protein 90 [Euphorbia peplus]|nr:NAC domain containing protein 90 [Euphorbia peplus]
MEITPGFRFYPTEEELVGFYLHHKLDGKRQDLNLAMDRVIPLLHIYDFDPWDLPQLSGEVCWGDQEQWFFFNPIQESEKHGGKPSRHNTTGYWKSTGSPSYVYSSSDNRCIGLKRTMVFYNGRVRNGSSKTDWKLNEYKAIQLGHSSSSSTQSNDPMIRQELSLCRVYTKVKCRRSFDRRPIGMAMGELSLRNIPELTRIEEKEEEATETFQNPLMADETTTLTPQNNGCFPSQTEHIDMAEATNNEPMWDWEYLYSWDYNSESLYTL